MELCHNHRRTGTRRYFTESWEKIIELCHNHRRFVHILKRTHIEGVVGRHVYRWIVRHVYRWNYRQHIYRRIEKSGGIFEIFWCEYQFITDRNYRWNLMPPTIINGLSVIPSEKLLYKTPLPPIWFIFSLGSSSPFLFSSSFLFRFWNRFYCFGGSFKHIKRYVFFFLYLCIFLF